MSGAPLAFVTVLLVVAAVASWAAVVYLWSLYRLDRDLYPGPRLRLTFVKAATSTMAAAASTQLALAALLRIGGFLDLVATITPVTITAILVLDFIPVISALYLRSRRGFGRRRRDSDAEDR